MIIAAADPNGPANMLATGLFWTVVLPAMWVVSRLTARTVRAIDRLAGRTVRPHIAAVLDHGDQQILRAVEEAEAAHRRRTSVPRQLTAERTSRP